MKRTFLPHPNTEETAESGGIADPVSEIIDPTSAAQTENDDANGDPATAVMAQADGDGGGTKNG